MVLKIRSLKPSDLHKVREIHERDFPNLDFPLDRPLMSAFIIEDENNEMIIAGGVEAIAEALLVTDTTKSFISIGRALVEAQRFAMFSCENFNIRELHAFVTSDDYARHLIKHGFQERTETVLRIIV